MKTPGKLATSLEEPLCKPCKTVSYTPSGLRIEGDTGRFQTTRLMFRELLSARQLIVRFFIRDISAKYRQSFLGILWVFLVPLATTFIFMFIRKAGVLNIENVQVPYGLYVLAGISFFHLFNGGLIECTNAMVKAGGMIVKINFPRIALVFAASLQTLLEFFIRMTLVVILCMISDIRFNPLHFVYSVLTLIPLYFFMLGIGCMLALIASVLRDIPTLINFIGMGVMLVTPILYPLKPSGTLAAVSAWNPLHYLINLPREMLLYGSSSLTTGFLICAGFSFVLFFTGWRMFYVAQTKITERI